VSKDSVNKQIAKGAAWMVAFKMLDNALGLVSTLVLARMLAPQDFGLVSMSMVLLAAMTLLMSFSFDIQLIQNPNAGREHFDTAWTFNVMLATGFGILMVLLAPVTAGFYREPRLETILYVMAAGFVLQGFSNIGTVKFRREMRFDREFKFLLSKRMSSLLVTIPLAIYLRNYWALVIGQLAGTVLSLVMSYVVSSYRPRFSLAAKGEMFHGSVWLFVNSFIQFLHNRAPTFVIARLSGAGSVGVYSIAAEISLLPSNELVAPINRAAFPGYAKAAHDMDKLRDSFLKVIASIALIALPAGIGIVSVAELLVPAALGWKWIDAIPIIQILAVYGVIKALQTNISYIYLVLGMTKRITLITSIQVLIQTAALIPAVYYYGPQGAAWSYLGTSILLIPLNQYLVAQCLSLSATRFCRELMRPLIASLAMMAVVVAIKSQLVLRHETLDYVLALLLCAATGALVYVGAMYALWRMAGQPAGAEEFAFRRVQGVLGKMGIRLKLVS
jgi:O-antigen/teichoic acid export membrane protein